MNEEIKIKINNLISLRQSLLGLLPILVGGTLGLLFVKGYFALKFVLICIGTITFAILMKSLYDTITELNQYLYKSKRD